MFNNAYGMMGPSLADIAAVTNGNRNNNDWGMMGGGWWMWILWAFMFGWGGYGGFGGFGGGYGNQQFTQADMQRGFDTQNLLNGQRGLEQGLCSLGYDQLGQFNNLNNAIQQSAFGLQQSINANNVANMQNTNALSRQLGDCCCENRQAISQVRYDMSTDTCAITTAIKDASNAQIQNCNANYQAIDRRIDMLERNQLMSENANLRQQLNDCNRDNAISAAVKTVVNEVRPTPGPAWLVSNPWANCGYPYAYSQGYDNYNYNNGGCCNRNNSCCSGC